MDINHKLLVNIGNTHTTISNLGLQVIVHCRTDELLKKIKLIDASTFYCASVVPSVQEELLKTERDYRFLQYGDLDNIDFTQVEPSSIGADRLANLLGVSLSHSGKDCLIIDCGTCVTGELLSGNQFLGGFIHPGRHMQRRALNVFTGGLPEIPLADTLPELEGISTAGAILTGVDCFSFLGLKAYVGELQLKYPELKIVLTGGDAAFYEAAFDEYKLVENLTLQGLKTFAQS
jgi:type III pantothenate kinase